MTTTIKLTGLTCEACTKLSQKRLAKIPGVMEVMSLPEQGSFSLTTAHPITKQDVQAVLEGTPYALLAISE